MTRIPGIDISHWNLDSGATAGSQIGAMITAGVQFIIAKASEGGSYTDPAWAFHKSKLLAHPEIVKGAYHWLINDGDGAGQADHFLGCLNGAHNPAGWLCAVDVEGDDGYGFSPPKMAAVTQFADEFWRQAPGQPLLVYSRDTYWGSAGDLKAYGLLPWTADYTQHPTIYIANFDTAAAGLSFCSSPSTPYASFSTFACSRILQWGPLSVAGVKVDGDVYNGSLVQLRALTQPSGAPVPVNTSVSGALVLQHPVIAGSLTAGGVSPGTTIGMTGDLVLEHPTITGQLAQIGVAVTDVDPCA